MSTVLEKKSECATGDEGICSPTNVISIMRQYAKTQGKNPLTDANVVTTVKDLLDCKSESCVLGHNKLTNFSNVDLAQILEQYFKPKGPALTTELLSNFNIDEVLEQFVSRFPTRRFLHIPFQMRDFAAVQSELATIDIAESFKQGYKTFGVVLNTDYSKNGGIHWYCLFGELYADHISIEYFNSSGNSALPETQVFLNETRHKLALAMNMRVDIFYTTGIRFQTSVHACGVFCLAYLWLRLEQVQPKWFNAQNFNDAHMTNARRNLFRHDR